MGLGTRGFGSADVLMATADLLYGGLCPDSPY
jgi:hypothetical protein